MRTLRCCWQSSHEHRDDTGRTRPPRPGARSDVHPEARAYSPPLRGGDSRTPVALDRRAVTVERAMVDRAVRAHSLCASEPTDGEPAPPSRRRSSPRRPQIPRPRTGCCPDRWPARHRPTVAIQTTRRPQAIPGPLAELVKIDPAAAKAVEIGARRDSAHVAVRELELERSRAGRRRADSHGPLGAVVIERGKRLHHTLALYRDASLPATQTHDAGPEGLRRGRRAKNQRSQEKHATRTLLAIMNARVVREG